jgi:hypothetical protein
MKTSVSIFTLLVISAISLSDSSRAKTTREKPSFCAASAPATDVIVICVEAWIFIFLIISNKAKS